MNEKKINIGPTGDGNMLQAVLIDAARPGAWDKHQDPELAEMREEERQKDLAWTAPTLEEFQARERAAGRMRDLAQNRRDRKIE